MAIDVVPNEVPEPIRFPGRGARRYDAAAATAFWRALVQADRVFRLFRTGFLGKASPVHFFWGSFDLAVTRFSGRPAPLHPGGVPGLPDAVTREAYSHEVSSAGFWPGSDAYPQAAFYSYAYPGAGGVSRRRRSIRPAPCGRRRWANGCCPTRPSAARPIPTPSCCASCSRRYRAAAGLGHWDPALECALGVPRRPRPVGP